MALQPIDVQTLFQQMETVGKTEAALRDGSMIRQALQGEQAQRRNLERSQMVTEAAAEGEGPASLKNDRRGEGGGGEAGGRKGQPEAEAAAARLWALPAVSDPRLGANVDISG